MKTKKCGIIFLIILISLGFSSVLSTSTLITSNILLDTGSPFIRSANTNISNYKISQSVTYKIEINYTVTQTSGIATYYFKMPRINNRTPNSSLTRFCPPYQESKLFYSNISNWDEINESFNDEFNNTYDAFNISLIAGLPNQRSVKFSQEYLLTLNEISYQDIDYNDIGNYDTDDIMFDLYCNRSEKYYNTSDPQLVSLSDSITTELDNPVEKAKDIFSWIRNNIKYEVQEEEKGASWAFIKGKGDCSEYADLMITLLRIEGIPARKVTGLVLSNVIPFFPLVGQVLTFNWGNITQNNILGHAWVEYYVPNIGWIACDPTWGYFNKIDYQRLGFNIGQWFVNATGGRSSEFPYPQLYGNGTGIVKFNYQLKATIVDASYWPWILLLYFPPTQSEDQTLEVYLYVGTGVVIATALLSTVVVFVNKKRKELI